MTMNFIAGASRRSINYHAVSHNFAGIDYQISIHLQSSCLCHFSPEIPSGIYRKIINNIESTLKFSNITL